MISKYKKDASEWNHMVLRGLKNGNIKNSVHWGCLGSSVIRAPFMRSGCRGFESRSGRLIFSSICSVYIDRNVRVDLSDDERNIKSFYVLALFALITINSTVI